MLAEAQCWTQSLSLKNLQLREANVDNQISKYGVRWVGREEFCVAFGQEERNSTGKGGSWQGLSEQGLSTPAGYLNP